MLVLDDARIPNCSESSFVQQDEIVAWTSFEDEISDQVTQQTLAIELSLQSQLIQSKRLQKFVHFGQPLRLKKSRNFRMFDDLHSVELPLYQIACRLQLILCEIVASAQIGKHFFTNRPRSIYRLVVDSLVVEEEVHNVEVVPSIDSAHHWHSVDEMMRKFMSMALHYSIYRSLRKRLQQQTHLVCLAAAALLGSRFLPIASRIVSIAVIAHMTHQNDSVNSICSQLSTTFHDDFCIFLEPVGRERAICESASRKGRFYSGKSNHSDFNA